MYQYYNKNPQGKSVGDCTVRAISKATGQRWEDVYMDLCDKGFELADMPSSNAVWGAYLHDIGFKRYAIPDNLINYTVGEFAKDNPKGTYILALSGHVVCVSDGVVYDAWDSSNENVVFYWKE